MTALNKKRIGYWVTEKKYKILNIKRLEILCRDLDLELVKLDLENDFEAQGPFDLIFHKMTDLLIKCNKQASTYQRFQSYVLRHPEMQVIDPLERVLELFDRHNLHQILKKLPLFSEASEYFLPAAVELLEGMDVASELQAHSIQFPIVCKSDIAVHVTNSGYDTGKMTVVMNEAGLSSISLPCFVQSFVNHNAVLWKVYVVGAEHFLVKRPSIKNLYPNPDDDPIYFHSSQVSKSTSSSPLNKTGAGEAAEQRKIGDVTMLAQGLRALLQLDLFGFDLVLEKDSLRSAVIDVNPFPSYDGVENFPEAMIRLFETKFRQ